MSEEPAQRISCPACGAALNLKTTRKDRKKLRCPKCRHVFVPSAASAKKRRRPEASKQTDISWKWNNLTDGPGPWVLILLLSIVAVVFVSTALNDSRTGVRIFCLIGSIPAATIVYRIVISRFNRTTMHLDGNSLSFHAGPFPWLPKRAISLDGASSVSYEKKFVAEHQHRGNRSDVYFYSVVAEFENGRRQTIVNCSRNRDQAKRITKFLTSNVSGLKSSGLQTNVNAVDPGVSSRVLSELNDPSENLTPIQSSAAEAEWQIDSANGTWTATRRWCSPGYGFTLIVLCGGLAAVLPPLVLNAHANDPIPAPGWLAVAIGGLTVLAGLYSGVALLANRTEISWDINNLSQKHLPMPWWSGKPIPTEQISGFDVERKLRASSRNSHRTTDLNRPRLRGSRKTTRMYQYDFLLLVNLSDGQNVRFTKTYKIERVVALQKILKKRLAELRGKSTDGM